MQDSDERRHRLQNDRADAAGSVLGIVFMSLSLHLPLILSDVLLNIGA